MESRQALPYVSHLRITKRPTRSWQPTGYTNQQGQDLYQQVTELPGIEIEVTPYLGEIKGPAQPFRFPSKKFFEDAKAELESKDVKTDQDTQAIANINATLARTDVLWCESVLEAAEVESLDGLWADVFSDLLDTFPSWNEADNSVGGIPIEIKEMQWDARVPAVGNKSIDLKVGVFCGDKEPEVYTLSFEDSATRSQRVAFDEQLQSRIDQLPTEIAAAQGQQKASLQQELEYKQAEKERRQKVEVGLIADVVSKPSVQAALPNILVASIAVLKQTVWPTVNIDLFTSRLGAALSKIS